MPDDLDKRFESYLGRDDDKAVGGLFFETLSEIERRREPETVEVTLRVIDGSPQFEPSDAVRTEANQLWVSDKRIVVSLAD